MFRVDNGETTLATDINLETVSSDNIGETATNIESSLNENNGGHLAFSTRENGGQLRPVFEINDHGAIAFNGSYGTAGQLLQTNGQASPPTWVNHTELPYHLVLNLNTGNFLQITSGTDYILNMLTVDTNQSINTNYNGDILNSTEWSPSISGLFQITGLLNIRAYGSTDTLIDSSFYMRKLVDGNWIIYHQTGDRRWGQFQSAGSGNGVFNEARKMSLVVYATPSDRFRWHVSGRAVGTNIVVMNRAHEFNISITKINSAIPTVFTNGLLNFNDNTTNELVSRIAGSLDGTNGGQLQLFTKTDNTPSTILERMTILGNGHVGIGTTTPEELFHVNGNSRTNRLISNVIESFSGSRNYIHLQSGDISLSAESKSSNGNNYKEFIIRGWVNPDNSEVDDAGATTSSQNRNHIFGAHLFSTSISYALLYVKNSNFLVHNSNGDVVTLYYNQLIKNSSDNRLKHNQINISDSLEVIRKLRAKSYDQSGSIDNLENTFHNVGFIAQDVYTIPQLKSFVDNPETSDNPEHDGIWKLNYEPIFIYTTQAVKELDTIVEEQKEEIDNLKHKNNLLKLKLNNILTEMGKETI